MSCIIAVIFIFECLLMCLEMDTVFFSLVRDKVLLGWSNIHKIGGLSGIVFVRRRCISV